MNDIVEHWQSVQLARVLSEVAHRSDHRFTGTSVVVCHALDGLPYCAMTEGWPIVAGASLADNLLAMANSDSHYHDGFHLLAPNFDFLEVACYLAPRIPDEAPQVSFAGRGSRFSTAYFMSLLSPVICVGIVSHPREVTVFRQGRILVGQGEPIATPTSMPPFSLSLVART